MCLLSDNSCMLPTGVLMSRGTIKLYSVFMNIRVVYLFASLAKDVTLGHSSPLSGPPADISFGAVDSTAMTLTWGLPQNDSSDGVVRDYVVDCGSEFDQGFALDLTRSAGEERSVVLQNLLPYTVYGCCLLVETDMGRSPFACVEETTLEEGMVEHAHAVTLTIAWPDLEISKPCA